MPTDNTFACSRPSSATALGFAVAAALAACGDDSTTAADARPPIDAPSSFDGAPPPPSLEIVARFDPTRGELPEGLALRDGVPAVGFAPIGEVRLIPATGTPTTLATSPPLPPNMAFITGLAVVDDRVYLALPSFVGDPAAGVYRTGQGGGAATPFTTGAVLAFPSDVEPDGDGGFYITDSAAGAILRASPAGDTVVWAADPLLQGGREICNNEEGLFDIGANGMVVTADAVLVVNTDRGSLIEIPVMADGSAGAPRERIASDCARLGGADGMTEDGAGGLYVALNRQNRVVHIAPDDTITTLVEGGDLDFPASVRIATVDGARYLYVTNFALANAVAGRPANPSLGRVRLDP